MAWLTAPAATSSGRSRPGRIGSPAASADGPPAGRGAAERRLQMAPHPAVDPLDEYCASQSSNRVHVSVLTMIAWRSPDAFCPPSIGVSAPNGYGPASLSLAYWNVIDTLGWLFVTFVNGIPYGTGWAP